MKPCTHCGVQKPFSDYYRNKKSKDGHLNKCKKCCDDYENQEDNKKRRLANQQKRRSSNSFQRAQAIFHTVKKGAKARDLEITITPEWILQELEEGKCAVTGLSFVFDSVEDEHTITTRKGRMLNPFSPSVDRIDCNKGYTTDNCQLVVSIYNYAKLSFSEQAVKIFCKAYLNNGNT
jgi:hypothetical protein